MFLDFDGVIVDSAKEAYAIAMLATDQVKTLSEVNFDSSHCKRFLKQRCHIGPAWNYYYLLKSISEDKDNFFTDVLPNEAGQDAKAFQCDFFAMRQMIRNYFWDEWLGLNQIYSGSERFIELINQHKNIVIVTTKDGATVKALLHKYGVERDVDIYDAKTYDKFGCKSLFIDDYIKKSSIKRSIFIDDSYSHLKKCEWVEGLEILQAKWGYVMSSDYEDNKEEVVNTIMGVLRG